MICVQKKSFAVRQNQARSHTSLALLTPAFDISHARRRGVSEKREFQVGSHFLLGTGYESTASRVIII
jgi:hypothetical protein